MSEHIGFKFMIGAFLYVMCLCAISMCSDIREMRHSIAQIAARNP